LIKYEEILWIKCSYIFKIKLKTKNILWMLVDLLQ
jgi:hypothetical protein